VDGFQTVSELLDELGGQAIRPEIVLAVRLALACVFVLAGIVKLARPVPAAQAAVGFRVTSRPSIRFAVALGAAEVLTGLLLVSPVAEAVLVGSGLALALSAAFAFVTARALVADAAFPCACLSSATEAVSRITFVRAVAMAGAGIYAVSLAASTEPYPPPGSRVGPIPLALAFLGCPILIAAGVRLWRAHRAYMRQIDWEWVLQAPALARAEDESARA
jgi:uncharacterized membrane protein YphA (DoxX/SURF4 family)